MKHPQSVCSLPPQERTKLIGMHMAVDKHYGCIGFGIVVRDYEEVILAARSTTTNVLAEPVVVEALAALHAVELCREMNFNDIILEEDAL